MMQREKEIPNKCPACDKELGINCNPIRSVCTDPQCKFNDWELLDRHIKEKYVKEHFCHSRINISGGLPRLYIYDGMDIYFQQEQFWLYVDSIEGEKEISFELVKQLVKELKR